jgi:hypothetical protein
VIGREYTKMIQKAISQREFPKGVNKGLITLIFKASMKEELCN